MRWAFSDESRQGKRLGGRTSVEVRSLAVRALTAHLHAAGVGLWTLDSIDPADRARDRRDIARELSELGGDAELRYDHLRSKSEPILWVADAVAWDVTHDRRLQRVRIVDAP